MVGRFCGCAAKTGLLHRRQLPASAVSRARSSEAVLTTSVRSRGLIRLLPGETGMRQPAVTLLGGTVGDVTG